MVQGDFGLFWIILCCMGSIHVLDKGFTVIKNIHKTVIESLILFIDLRR